MVLGNGSRIGLGNALGNSLQISLWNGLGNGSGNGSGNNVTGPPGAMLFDVKPEIALE